MISFGEENNLKNAPFLMKAVEESYNRIIFTVALACEGEKGAGVYDEDMSPALKDIIAEAKPIYPDEKQVYEIVFEDYLFHVTRNESFVCCGENEVGMGRYFVIFKKSKLLDLLPQLVEAELAKAIHTKAPRHYGVYCQDHIIDVISASEPLIRKAEAAEPSRVGRRSANFKIYEHLGALSPENNGMTKELNFVSWDDREPVYDIRTWNREHSEYGRGVTITRGQMAALKELLDGKQRF